MGKLEEKLALGRDKTAIVISGSPGLLGGKAEKKQKQTPQLCSWKKRGEG